ncbi:MAG: hypothetical protein M4579_005434, partial [Chaenotheca gracillima]
MVMRYYSQRGSDEPITQCDFCGRDRYEEEEAFHGQCKDPDWCGACDLATHGELFHVERQSSYCMESGCICGCHDAEWDRVPDAVADQFYEWEWFDRQPGNGFPFLYLPREIRNMIYEYAFTAYRFTNARGYFRGRIETSLMHVNQQVYLETYKLPLAINEFWFTSPWKACKLLKTKLFFNDIRFIKKVHLDIGCINDLRGNVLATACDTLATMRLDNLAITIKGAQAGLHHALGDILLEQLGKIKKAKQLDLLIGVIWLNGYEKIRIVQAVLDEMNADIPTDGVFTIKKRAVINKKDRLYNGDSRDEDSSNVEDDDDEDSSDEDGDEDEDMDDEDDDED